MCIHVLCSLSAFDIDNITIRLGDHNLKRIHETRHAVRRVRRIVRNKTFNTSTLHGDIAIIQVTQFLFRALNPGGLYMVHDPTIAQV